MIPSQRNRLEPSVISPIGVPSWASGKKVRNIDPSRARGSNPARLRKKTLRCLGRAEVFALPPNDATNRPFCHLKPAGFRTPNRHVAGPESLLFDSCPFAMPIFYPPLFHRPIGDKTD